MSNSNLKQSILNCSKTNLSFEIEDNHPLFSKQWNSYEEFKRDLEQFQTSENVILSVVFSKLIQNNQSLKDKFHYQSCTIKCKHGTRQRNNLVNGSRPNQHTFVSGCEFGGILKYNETTQKLYFSKVLSTAHSNHPTSSEIYQVIKRNDLFKENNEATKLAETLINAKAPIHNILYQLNNQFSLKLKHKDLHNYRQNIHKINCWSVYDSIRYN